MLGRVVDRGIEARIRRLLRGSDAAGVNLGFLGCFSIRRYSCHRGLLKFQNRWSSTNPTRLTRPTHDARPIRRANTPPLRLPTATPAASRPNSMDREPDRTIPAPRGEALASL